jgi:hypothetical protein
VRAPLGRPRQSSISRQIARPKPVWGGGERQQSVIFGPLDQLMIQTVLSAQFTLFSNGMIV